MSLPLRTFKIFVDFFFVVFVALSSWFLLIIWVAIKLDSEGPGFFWQERVGRNGHLFHCLKFRTMYIDTDNMGTHLVTQSSVTRVGRFLRATKIDELPQAWNIVRRDMTLIGPRPCLPSQNALISARNQKGVLEILPGITGWAQIHGIDMSNPSQLAEFDSNYLEHASIACELQIIYATAVGGGHGDNTRV